MEPPLYLEFFDNGCDEKLTSQQNSKRHSPMKHGHFKSVVASVSDTDTPWTHMGHVSDMPRGMPYIFNIFLKARHVCPFKGHTRDTVR